uniref:Acid phosphatase n=1 Tax=Cuerna arida TaxID=1464854 RepID=A0A1B6EXK4_9HEMI
MAGHPVILLFTLVPVFLATTSSLKIDVGCHAPKSTDGPKGSRATPSLQLVSIYTRHGTRGPMDDFPNFPHPLSDASSWPHGQSQLTEVGRAQAYKLGSKIRSLYNGFLNEDYCENDVKAYSTLTDRTLMTAQLFLAGLYPPMEYHKLDVQIPLQPIPVYPSTLDNTEVVMYPEHCPRFKKAYDQSLSDCEEEFGQNITDFMKYVQPYTGLPVANESVTSLRLSVFNMWEALSCAKAEGLPMPNWVQNIRNPLESLMKKLFVASTSGSDEMIRLFEGMLFQELVKTMEAKLNGTLNPDSKIILHSGHDLSLLGLQAILGVLEDESTYLIVDTGSALIFELHKDPVTDQAYVQVLFICGASADLKPEDVNIPACGSPCEFTKLKEITEKYYNITDYKKECLI